MSGFLRSALFGRGVSRGAAAACAAAMAVGTSNYALAQSEKKKDAPTPKSVAEIIMSLATKGRHVFVNGRVDDESARIVIATLMCACNRRWQAQNTRAPLSFYCSSSTLI
jgi:hypothetical protein